MKVAVLGDTHFGARNDSAVVHNFFKKFFEEKFFPFLIENNITHFIQVGDLFDRRKYVNFNTLYLCREYFFDRLKELNLTMIVFPGNHDIFYKNTLKVNSLNLLLQEYNHKNILIIDRPCDYDFHDNETGSYRVTLLPWICDDNAEETFEHIRETKSQICIGHLELSGFEMYKGTVQHEGMDASLFSKFEMVLSGHYHHRSSRGNIHYLGVPYEMTWSDYNDPKGFHVLDLHKRSLTFIENPFRMYHKISYDDSNTDIKSLIEHDFSRFKNTYVKVIVKNKNNPYWFDLFTEALEKVDPVNIQVVDDNLNLQLESDEDIVDEAEDTMTILNKYVDNLDLDTDRPALNSLMRSLYEEALSIE
jgi:DNA repair exonuclease SbcCD nuclease subunit